jgi:hypothetical protein
MWLAFPIFVLVFLAIVGGLVVGGVYLLVLLPLALLVIVGYVAYAMWKRSSEATLSRAGAADPLPHTEPGGGPATPASPDDLVDARQHL